MQGFACMYADEHVRALFSVADENYRTPFDGNEYKKVMRFISRYEYSVIGKVRRTVDKITERYKNGMLWRMYKLKTFLTSGIILPY